MMKLEMLGWAATAAFASSYFFKNPRLLRAVQGGAAVLWIGYGLMIGATPVIVANVIVALAAAWSMIYGNLGNSGNPAALRNRTARS